MVKALIFDIDNTLYPASAPINLNITRRMVEFAARLLGLSYEEAYKERMKAISHKSTTLEWLQTEGGLKEPSEFFHYVHPASEIEELPQDTKLRAYIEGIKLPKAILTNAPIYHATRVLDFYNIRDLFLGIVDIDTCQLKGKPYPASYGRALALLHAKVEDTVFVDDCVKYLKGYTALGGRSVLVGDGAQDSKLWQGPSTPSIYGLVDILKTL